MPSAFWAEVGAMPPLPKRNPARRNKPAGKATLTLQHSVKAPKLPDLDRPWHAMTLSWWADVWSSPMAPEYDDSDRHGLFILATLVDTYWHQPSAALAGEIRLQRQCFGLTPIDRRRLQWEIERGDEAEDKGRRRRASTGDDKPKTTRRRTDPRAALRAVE